MRLMVEKTLGKVILHLLGTSMLHWAWSTNFSIFISSISCSVASKRLSWNFFPKWCLLPLVVLYRLHQSHSHISMILNLFPVYKFDWIDSLLGATSDNFFSKRETYFLTGTEVIEATHFFELSVALWRKPVNTDGFNIRLSARFIEALSFTFCSCSLKLGLDLYSKAMFLFWRGLILLISESRTRCVLRPVGIGCHMS